MSNRLQIIVNDKEFSMVKQAARKKGTSVSDWVRGLIRERLARSWSLQQPQKLQDSLGSLNLPAPPIDQMLAEIEQGRF